MADIIPPAILPVATRAYCRRKKLPWSAKVGDAAGGIVMPVMELLDDASKKALEIMNAGNLANYFGEGTVALLEDDEDEDDDPYGEEDEELPAPGPGGVPKATPRPELFMAFDCECVAPLTQTMPGFENDPRWDWRTQNLTFGVARIGYFGPDGKLCVSSEIIFYRDDLPKYGVDILRQYFVSRTYPSTASVRQKAGAYVVGLPEREADPSIEQRHWKEEPEISACLMRLSDFLKEFYRIAYQMRGLVIGFNLPFDLSRLAYVWGISKERKTLGGWSLGLWAYLDQETHQIKQNRYRPRIRIKKAGPNFSFISFTGCKDGLLEYPENPELKKPYKGQFLDLGTMVFALTARRGSLAWAVKTFCNRELDKDVEHGIITPKYIDYGRNDVKATVELAGALLNIFDNHPVSQGNGGRLAETEAYSPASLAKAYLKAAGFSPPIVPEDRIGPSFGAFYGGWTEVGVRGKVPVVLLDFKKMYQTQFILQDIHNLFAAERLSFVDDTENVRCFLNTVTLGDLFEPDTWPMLTAICWVIPDGDILMTKARFDEKTFSSGMVPRYSDEKVPYYLADLVLSKLLTGKAPNVLKAERIIGDGRQELCKTTLPGGVEFDPYTQNFFKLNVEEGEKIKDVDDLLGLGENNHYRGMDRDTRLALVAGIKALGNSGSYGIFAETNEQDLPGGVPERVELLHDSEATLEAYLLHPENPGRFCCPPLAGLIPAGARLLLGMAHRLVMDRGGTVAFGDTDSLAIVATETGEQREVETVARGPAPVKTLTWSEVIDIVGAFTPLNPYDQSLIKGSILEIKEVDYAGEKKSAGFAAQSTRDMIELTALCISSKRYDLARPNGTLADKKKSMLGMLLSPLDPSPGDDRRDASQDWIEEAWLAIDDLWERRRVDRAWMERPSVRRMAATSPAVMKNLAAQNPADDHGDEEDESNHLTASEEVRPFNFFVAATAVAGRRTQAVVAPFERDPERWNSLFWLRTDDGSAMPLGIPDRDGIVWRLKTVGEFLRDYVVHHSPEWVGADGFPCHAETRGVLTRRPVYDGDRYLLTKENLTWADDPKYAFTLIQPIEQQIAGQERRAKLTWNMITRPAVKAIGSSAVAKRLNTDARTARRWQAGTATPVDISAVEKAAVLCAEDLGLFTADEMRQHSSLSLLKMVPERVERLRLFVAFMVTMLIEKHGSARAFARGMSEQRPTSLSRLQSWRHLDKLPGTASDLNAIVARLAGFSKKTLRDLRRRIRVGEDPVSQQHAVSVAVAALHNLKFRVQEGILDTPISLEKQAQELMPAEAVIWFPAIALAVAALSAIAQAIIEGLARWRNNEDESI